MDPWEDPDASADAIAQDLSLRYRERLLLFAARKVRDVALAEDIVQETLRRVLEALREKRILRQEALPAFIFQTAQNVCLHHYRFVRRTAAVLLTWTHSQRNADNREPIDALISAEEAGRVREALRRLDESDRMLLSLLYVEGREARDVAKSLDITVGTLRVRKFRALRRLEQILRGEETFSRDGER